MSFEKYDRLPDVPNIRFQHEGATITLEPGQRLSHTQGGPDDEGYWFSSWDLHYTEDGSAVILETCSGGRDCDGYLEHNAGYVWKQTTWRERTAGFVCVDRGQRDEYAEAAGY